VSHRSTEQLVIGASLSHPDAAGLQGATLRAPIASSPQMFGLAGAESIPEVHAQSEIEIGVGVEPSLSLDVGLGTRPTQPILHTSVVDVTVSGDTSGFTDVNFRFWGSLLPL